LKKWFGHRANQCKALLGMIAQMDHPAAIQLLLSVRNNFRTKGIQDEAAKLVEEVAERKSWSVNELADRSVPDAGFDQKGVMELSFGKRTFTSHLAANLKIVLKDPSGKEIKVLPNPNSDDDKELASIAKKELSNRQKELQVNRLYEAMCTQRTWRVEDWEQFLLKHPIVGRYVQSLVWAETVDKKIVRLFRPMGDGSYTDAKDAEIKLTPHSIIQLPHECLVDETEARSWVDHLSEYAIIPPFSQFGKHRVSFSTILEKTTLDGFKGHLLAAFKLRTRAEKLGYARGQSEHIDQFYSYVKRLPALGITIDLGFTGNTFPEVNRVVGLTELCFQQQVVDEDGEKKVQSLALKDVPLVLLAECWNDLALLSAEGTGFDPDWEQKCVL
jgi:hypothetical protein